MINILFGGNYKVFDGILLTVLSAIKHCDVPLNIYILTADLSDFNPEYKPIQKKDIEFLNKIVKQKNPHSNVTRIMIGDEFKNWALNGKNHLNQYTPFAFLNSTPVLTLMCKFNNIDALIYVGVAFGWLALLELVNHLMFKFCIRRVTVQGG